MGEAKDDIHVCILCMRAIMNNKVRHCLQENRYKDSDFDETNNFASCERIVPSNSLPFVLRDRTVFLELFWPRNSWAMNIANGSEIFYTNLRNLHCRCFTRFHESLLSKILETWLPLASKLREYINMKVSCFCMVFFAITKYASYIDWFSIYPCVHCLLFLL